MKDTEILAIPHRNDMSRYRFSKMLKYAESKGVDLLDLTESECKMFEIREPITLYTIQTLEGYQQAKKKKILQGNIDFVTDHFKSPYEWLIAQMNQRIGHNDQFPIWLWAEKRDLTDEALLPSGTMGVQLKVELTTDLVLASDFDAWHCVLNNDYLTLNEEEDSLVKAGQFAFTKEQTWERIFDGELLSAAADYWGVERTYQYTTGAISLMNVSEIEFFVAK